MLFQNRIHLIMNHVMEANDLWMGVPVQSEDHFWGEIGSVQFYCMLSRFRAVGAAGAVGAPSPKFLADQLTLSQPRGRIDYAYQIITYPRIFRPSYGPTGV